MATERRRREQEVSARDRATHQQSAAQAQHRREDARASALLSYSFYAAKLGERFSRAMFDQYVEQYMSDKQPPEVVERRGQELLAIFEKHLADVRPAKKESSLESITRWYQQTKAQIEALPLDDDVKEVRLIELERRFAELLSGHLEGTTP